MSRLVRRARSPFVTVGRAPADYVTDGVADEVQIQRAINAMNVLGGGTIYLKDLSYHVSISPIALKDGVWIKGAGRASTVIYGDSTLGTNAVMLGTASLGSPLTDCTISDLKIDGSNMPTSPVSTFRKGIDVLFTLRMLVYNVHIYRTPATGFGPDCNIDFEIDNCIFQECGTTDSNPGYNGLGIGTGFYERETGLISNCIALDCYNNGFLLEYVGGGFNSRHYQFTNCYAYGNKRGFRVSGASGATFMNCKAINSDFNGFYLQLFGSVNINPENTKIIGCDAYNNGDDGIFFKDQDYGQINIICEGNHAYSNAGDGIVSAGNYAQIKDNTCWNNDNDGIYYHANSAVATGDAHVTGNICYNNGQAGVSGRGDGLRIHGELGTINSVIVQGNTCFDNQDILTVTDGSISAVSSTTTLTSATAGFKTTDAGKPITIAGAGIAGVDLVTTIASYTSPTQIKVATAASTTVTGATVTYGVVQTQQFGLTVKDYANNVILANNICHDNTKSGIFYQITTAITAVNARIVNNICYNNGRASVSTATDGIRVWGSGSGLLEGVLIQGNRCYDNQSSKTQTWGIVLKDNVSQAIVRDNDVRGNLTAGILNSPTATDLTNVFLNNKGWNSDEAYSAGNITGAVTVNRANGQAQYATLTGNITVTMTAGVNVGDRLTLVFTQDGTGSRTVTWPSNFKKAGGTLTLSTAASSVDTIEASWDGTNWREVSRSMGLS